MSAEDMRRLMAEAEASEKEQNRLEQEKQNSIVRERNRTMRKKVPFYVKEIKRHITLAAAKGESKLTDAWEWGSCIDDRAERATAEAIARHLRIDGYTVNIRTWSIYPRLNSEGYELGGTTTHWGRVEVEW